MGLNDEDLVKNAKETKKKIKKQNVANEVLEAAIDKRVRGEIKAALAEGEAIGLAHRFEATVNKANKLLALMELEDSLVKVFKKAGENSDEDALDDGLKKAADEGCSVFVFEAAEAAKKIIASRK